MTTHKINPLCCHLTLMTKLIKKKLTKIKIKTKLKKKYKKKLIIAIS